MKEAMRLPLLRISGTHALNYNVGKPVPGRHAAFYVLDALDVEAQEPANEGITSTVGIDDVLLGDLDNRVSLDSLCGGQTNDGILGAVGDDDDTGARGVNLGRIGDP
ncbi:hypothetical protein BC938DRAFT_472138 [Jimgerdemannia flammicorona]|uniref:Uncharacterized protein n=1 Tax=Jimgerdemannia flammicorona TaxID=994334 RepID=A0A433Q6Q9_9FUNG|nr:hypothetical protein BC938DRAFT_472138 [Jimgerdemannia flammicorona]